MPLETLTSLPADAAAQTASSPAAHAATQAASQMSSQEVIAALYVFALAAFLGYLVISKVPPLLHTPLMSATNAISGISLVGSLVIAGGKYGTVATVLGVVAVTAATINVVGGFVITDRMLRMFKREVPAKKAAGAEKGVKA